MRMKSYLILATLVTAAAVSAAHKTTVVTSSTDLAAIVQEIGGPSVEVSSIAKGKSNLHFVEMLPSYMLKVSKADIYFKIGLSMDQWADGIIVGSRNGRLQVVDCSAGIEILEKPSGKVDASMGDVHPDGNPHYWLDPRNARVIAQTVLEGLCRIDPGNRDVYQVNRDSFVRRLDSAWQVWSGRAEPLKGTPVISYHSSWAYFARAFGIRVAGFIEPKPGIEPTASHTAELIDIVRKERVKVIFREPYFSDRAPNAIAQATGAQVYTVPSSVGGTDGAKDYFSLFDELIGALLKGTASRD